MPAFRGIGGRCVAAAALAGGVWLAAASPAAAQQSPTVDWQKRYTAIAGAWFLERRCGFLGTARRREFEWLSAQLTLGYARRFGLARVRALQDLSIRLIRGEGYTGCGANNRRIVREALPWARADLLAATGQRYDAETSYRDYALGRFVASVARSYLDARCDHVPADEKNRLDDLRRAAITGLVEAYGAEPVGRALDRAQALARRDETPCGDATKARLSEAIEDLRELRREFAK